MASAMIAKIPEALVRPFGKDVLSEVHEQARSESVPRWQRGLPTDEGRPSRICLADAPDA
jgi:hypothetical protein